MSCFLYRAYMKSAQPTFGGRKGKAQVGKGFEVKMSLRVIKRADILSSDVSHSQQTEQKVI